MVKQTQAGEFYISSLTHELKAPLTTIHLYAEALISGSMGSLNSDQKDYLLQIHTSAKKAIDKINELREIADRKEK